MKDSWICPQCLMQWEADIGKCPCTSDPLRPAFVVKLDRFLASSNLERLKEYFEDNYPFPIPKDYVLSQLPVLEKIKADNLDFLKTKYGEELK